MKILANWLLIYHGQVKHYKGGLYNIMCVGTREADLKKLVVYQGNGCKENPSGIWIRPIEEFNEEVLYNGKFVKRFEPVKKAI